MLFENNFVRVRAWFRVLFTRQLVKTWLLYSFRFSYRLGVGWHEFKPVFYKDFKIDANFKTVTIYLAQRKHETDGNCVDGVSNRDFQRGDCDFFSVADVRNSGDKFKIKIITGLFKCARSVVVELSGVRGEWQPVGELRHKHG